MKGLILAAGKGSRIAAISEGTPKSMLPLGNTTLIGQSLSHFEDLGIQDLVMSVGYKRHVLQDHVKGLWPHKPEFVFNPHFDTTNVLYSFWLALPFIGDNDFVFLHADTVFSKEVLNRVAQHDCNADFVFAVDDHPCEEEEMKVLVKDGLVTHVNKQMQPDTCQGEFLGLARVSARMVPLLREVDEATFEDGGFQSFFEVAVQTLIDAGKAKVEICDVTGLPWREVDFPEDYEAARAFFD